MKRRQCEELFDCDGEELNHGPLLESDDSDQDDEENGDPSNEGEQSQTENQQNTTVAPVLLASIVKENSELGKDAISLDNLGTLFSPSDTSDKFIAFMNNFKRNYIAARGEIKNAYFVRKKKWSLVRKEIPVMSKMTLIILQTYLITCLLKLLAFLYSFLMFDFY